MNVRAAVADDALRAEERREVSLWVLSGNARGVGFYRAAGLAPVAGSAQRFDLGGRQVEEVQMLRSLDAGVPSAARN
ncbi:MAG: hypothetical protein IPM15_21045 [Betaproteobacteria bacterium]|nr:hypothetical protein [Betaproteobacteria bacterium]MCC6246434.1 hypothetical protein [Rubrivivax sp.]MCL4699590.1 hypothetical protein [Burkholderiaceae bacterium]